MAKSKRSKVKMAYKAMRRSVMESAHDAKLRATAAKVYSAIGLEMPQERDEADKMPARNHGGCELVSTFVPTPKGPKLNVVHGPNAVDESMLRLPKEVVGLPLVGAGAVARARAETGMEVERVEGEDERPYFYPRRERKKGGIRKKRKDKKGKK